MINILLLMDRRYTHPKFSFFSFFFLFLLVHLIFYQILPKRSKDLAFIPKKFRALNPAKRSIETICTIRLYGPIDLLHLSYETQLKSTANVVNAEQR